MGISGSVEVSVAPASEPVSTAEAKAWVRQDLDADDTLIGALITAAREQAEIVTGRALITQTLVWRMDGFPGHVLRVPRPPLQSVTSIAYTDTAGDAQTLAASKYQVDTKSQPGRLAPVFGEVWPTVEIGTLNPLTITLVAGYGDNATDVPEGIRHGIMGILAHLYEHRESVVTGTIATQLPQHAIDLLEPYRVPWF